MSHEPKRRHSRQRQGERRASISYAIPNAIVCPNCSTMTMPHAICKKCGFYRGKEYISHKSAIKETPAISETPETA